MTILWWKHICTFMDNFIGICSAIDNLTYGNYSVIYYVVLVQSMQKSVFWL